METLYYSIYDSPIGRLTIVISRCGLLRLELPSPHGDKRAPRRSCDTGASARCSSPSLGPLLESEEETRPYVRELQEYFAAVRRQFSFPLDLRGTDFQQCCWRALLQIPYGQTRTYGEMARVVGRPRAFRAVGMANHDNPIAIVVPCHRVIASNGTLGGYGGGLPMKRKLLELEGAMSIEGARLY